MNIPRCLVSTWCIDLGPAPRRHRVTRTCYCHTCSPNVSYLRVKSESRAVGAPQIFTLTIDGVAAALTHSVGVTVNVQPTALGIANVVNQERSLGCIDNSGISEFLIAQLYAVQDLKVAGRAPAAEIILALLVDEIRFEDGKHIATGCTDANANHFNPAQALISDIQALQATIASTAGLSRLTYCCAYGAACADGLSFRNFGAQRLSNSPRCRESLDALRRYRLPRAP
jgi:hypothetical protein